VTASRGKRADEIFEAAVKVFYERSYAGANVQDVADEVGILKGSLYHYIATKEDLLFWLFEVVHEQVEAIKVAAEAATELHPLQRLESGRPEGLAAGGPYRRGLHRVRPARPVRSLNLAVGRSPACPRSDFSNNRLVLC
jgi:AcrR family transcriptional regulator